MGKVINIGLGKKDGLFKTWYDLASEQNKSSIITSALLYYKETGEYLEIGAIKVDDTLPNKHKNIYFADMPALEQIFDDWKKSGRKAGTEIKRIISRGLKSCEGVEEVHIIDESDALEAWLRVSRRAHILPQEETVGYPPVVEPKEKYEEHERVESRLEPRAFEVTEQVKERKSKVKKKDDFILGFIPEGCGLGEEL